MSEFRPAMHPAIVQLLVAAQQQLARFKWDQCVVEPEWFNQSITVARVRQPESPSLWRVDLQVSFVAISGPKKGRVIHAGWPTWHTNLTEALLRAGRNAELFHSKIAEKGHRRD